MKKIAEVGAVLFVFAPESQKTAPVFAPEKKAFLAKGAWGSEEWSDEAFLCFFADIKDPGWNGLYSVAGLKFIESRGREVVEVKEDFTLFLFWGETEKGFKYHTLSSDGYCPAIVMPSKIEDGVYLGRFDQWGFVRDETSGDGDFRSPIIFKPKNTQPLQM